MSNHRAACAGFCSSPSESGCEAPKSSGLTRWETILIVLGACIAVGLISWAVFVNCGKTCCKRGASAFFLEFALLLSC